MQAAEERSLGFLYAAGIQMSGSVFVIDHDAHLTRLVQTVLEKSELSVVSYRSGREALEQLILKEPVLLIVGEKNDETDGLGFVVKLREKDRSTPVVFVAARWKEPDFYKVLREELNVALVAHRPLKSSIFKVQLEDVLLATTAVDDPEPGVELPIPSASTADYATAPGLEKWKRMFIASIPARMEKLGSLLKELTHDFNASRAHDALIVAHNLKGTSLSWGLTNLGETAAQIEHALKSCDGNGHSGVALKSAEKLFLKLDSYARTIASEHADEKTADTGEPVPSHDVAVDKAHILVVGEAKLPHSDSMQKSGIGVEMIHTSHNLALDAASKVALDAALIEISAEGETESSFTLARQLRDLHGYENLPLAFIVPEKESRLLEGASRAHAGGSLMLERPLDAAVVEKVVGRLLSLAEGGRFRVMVVDDDPDMSSLVCRCLGQFGIIAIALNDPLQANSVLNDFNPDLLLLDVMMPGITGFELCKRLRSNGRWRDLPIIFLTSQTDLASRITAYEAGADDYLPKPVINVELLTRVKARLEKARELKERSERDLLTGLLLRRPFSEQANALIAEAERYNFEFTLALLDVDHFKKVNDSYGHECGDLVLSTVGKLLKKRFRVEDLRGRWGGEEFILAFRHENMQTMNNALTRVLNELKSIRFPAGDTTFGVSFSAGLTSFPSEGRTLHGLVQVADRRLYRAKNLGRSMVVIED